MARVEVALVEERAAEVVAGGRVVGMGREQRAERAHRLLAGPGVHEGEPEGVPRVGRVGLQRHRAAQGVDGAPRVAQRLERDAQVQVGPAPDPG